MTDHQPLTTQQLDEYQALTGAATPGPWGVYESGPSIDIAADLHDTGCGYRARREICSLEDGPLDNDTTHREWTAEEDWAQVQADAAFIAASRTAVPALLADNMRLRTVLTTLAERWEQLAASHAKGIPDTFHVDLSPFQRQQIGKAESYRKAAADVREVLRTGRIPHDLMTDAEEEQAAPADEPAAARPAATTQDGQP